MNEPDELFPLAEILQESPRLRWLKKHNVITFSCAQLDSEDYIWLAAFDKSKWVYKSPLDFFAQETAEFGDTRIGSGDTEDDAICMLARMYRVRLWNEETPF